MGACCSEDKKSFMKYDDPQAQNNAETHKYSKNNLSHQMGN